MDKTYKYIKIVEAGQKPKTKIFHVVNKKSGFLLGVIEWFPAWRQYCFMPKQNAVFSADCLIDIADFISLAKAELKGR